jgi:hypothetical protein
VAWSLRVTTPCAAPVPRKRVIFRVLRISSDAGDAARRNDRHFRVMTVPSQPNEFRYRADTERGARRVLMAAGVLLLASFISGAWGIVSLVNAATLHIDDMPFGDNVFWGVLLLAVATLQGITALLVLFDRPSGVFLGILLATVAILSHLGAIPAYPAWSITAILVNGWVILTLVTYGRRPSH